MFRAWCEAEGSDVLLTTRRITAVHRSPGAVRVAFTCWCGHAGHTVDRAVATTPPRATAGSAPAAPRARPVAPRRPAPA